MPGRRLALVVATDRYDDPTLRGLAAPGADAAALADVLGDPDLGGFEVDVLNNPTSWVAAAHVERLLCERHSSDLVLMHFSCHGLKDESGELFLAARNTTPGLLSSTAVDAALVNRLMRRSRAQRVLLFLDCCYGGAFERGVVTRADDDVHVGGQFSEGRLGGGRGMVVITASSAMEYALEGTDLTITGQPKPSLFTGALVDGLRSGEADRDQDGNVALDELYDYVFDKVQERSPNQTPSKWEFGLQGDLIIARNPRRRIVPAPLSNEILELAQHPTPGVRLGAIDELAQTTAGPNLQLGAGAALLLRQLLTDDSRRVAEAAATALTELALQLPDTEIDLGTIPVGSAAVVEIPVAGSPLALASTIATSAPQLQARLNRSVLRVEATGSTPGPLRGWVSLTGPIGEKRVDVTASITAGAPMPHGSQPDDLSGTSTLRMFEQSHVSAPLAAQSPIPTAVAVSGSETPGPRLTQNSRPALIAVLLTSAAAAIVAANVLPPDDYSGLFALPSKGAWLRLLPGVAVLLVIPGLLTPRARSVAVGIIAGTAAWSGALWLKLTVNGLASEGLAETAQAWLDSGMWARLVAFLLLAAAAGMLVARSVDLRAPVTLARDARAVAAGVLVLCGAGVPLVETITAQPAVIPRTATLTVVVVGICLPVAVIRLGSEQRSLALTAATAFLLFTWDRDVWVVVSGTATPHLGSTVAGLLIVLVGCYLGGTRRIHSRPGTPEP